MPIILNLLHVLALLSIGITLIDRFYFSRRLRLVSALLCVAFALLNVYLEVTFISWTVSAAYWALAFLQYRINKENNTAELY